MIIESIVTTMDPEGRVNFAPMGVEWGEETIVVKPFLETTTFRNLRDTGAAVVNLTDDVLLFARAAISNPQYPATPAVRVRGAVLEAACSWRELEVRAIDDTPPRSPRLGAAARTRPSSATPPGTSRRRRRATCSPVWAARS